MAGAIIGRLTAAVIAATCVTAVAEEEDPWKSRTFDRCYLQRDAQGAVWLRHPVVALGMVGVPMSPDIRLSPELTERFADLVISPGAEPSGRGLWDFSFAPARRGRGPVFLLKIESQTKAFEPATQPDARDRSPVFDEDRTREIIAARLLEAEVMSPACIEAWQILDKSIAKVVELSRTAPTAQKREEITTVIEQGGRAAATMARMKRDDALLERVRKIEPSVSFTMEYQEHLRESWQDTLEAIGDVLRIKPTTKLPPIARRWLSSRARLCPTVELVAKAESPAAFAAEIEKSWPPETIGQPVFHAHALKRFLLVRDVVKLTTEQFTQVRAQAGQELEKQDRELREKTELLKKKWGLALRWADAETLAGKLLLRGLVVEEVSSEGTNPGFKEGDIIIDYIGIHDLTMGGLGRGRDSRPVSIPSSRGKIDLLRGAEVITLTVPK